MKWGKKKCFCKLAAYSRGLFQNLLVPALNRTVTLKEINSVSHRVSKHLDLNVSGKIHTKKKKIEPNEVSKQNDS